MGRQERNNPTTNAYPFFKKGLFLLSGSSKQGWDALYIGSITKADLNIKNKQIKNYTFKGS